MQNSKITDFAALIEKSAGHGTLKNVVFHSPRSGDAKKAKGVLKTISGERVLQVEFSLTEGRVTQENVAFDKIPEATERYLEVFGHADLTDRDGTASLMTSKTSLLRFSRVFSSQTLQQMQQSKAFFIRPTPEKNLQPSAEMHLQTQAVCVLLNTAAQGIMSGR